MKSPLPSASRAGLLALCLGVGWFAPMALAAQPSTASLATTIPDRPEKLSFKPLAYQPPAPEQYRVALKAGPIAYVVPDRELPLVNLVIYLRIGHDLVPPGQEGLASLTGHLLARGGIPSKSAEELEERLDFLAAQLNSGIDDTMGTISLNLLSKDLAEGLQILREVLTAPRFQADKLALRKQQTLQMMKQRNDDSADIEARERRFLSYGENFWLNRHATAASLEALTASDLRTFHQRWFSPSNFVVAASGDFVPAELIGKLETLFGAWPFKAEKAPAIPTNTVFAAPGVYLVDKDVNQGRVTLVLPGLRRDDPEYFAATVMNDILGGGGFTSRIMNRVRSDEGLAYSASSSLVGGVFFPGTFTAAFQSKSRTVAYATSIVLDEMKKIAGSPVTEEELDTAKKGLIDSFPRTFATRAQTANIFAQDEITGRFAQDPEYWKSYRTKIAAVARENVLQSAQHLLHPERLVVLVVGQKEEILKGHPDHPVTLKSLAADRLIDRPLRDPLTMQPLRP